MTKRLNIVSWVLAYLLLCWPRIFLQSVHRYILDEVTWKDYTPLQLYFSFHIANKLQQLYDRNVVKMWLLKNKITSFFKTFRVSLLSISGVLSPPHQGGLGSLKLSNTLCARFSLKKFRRVLWFRFHLLHIYRQKDFLIYSKEGVLLS